MLPLRFSNVQFALNYLSTNSEIVEELRLLAIGVSDNKPLLLL